MHICTKYVLVHVRMYVTEGVHIVDVLCKNSGMVELHPMSND